MTSRTVWRRQALLIAAVALMFPRAASASMEACTQAHAAGQREENAGHLKEALASFEQCAADTECPLPIRNECTSLYSKVEGRLPTLVFSVVDDSGNDVTDVQVASADTQIATGLDGRPVAINPGLHEFSFTLASGEVLTKSVSVRQGEKDRLVSVKLPRSQFAASNPVAVSTDPESSGSIDPNKRFHMPLASWVSYGVGAAALGAWGAFALVGRNQEKDLVDCSPRCGETRREDYDAMKRNYLIADISLGVAAAAVVAGTVVLFTMGRRAQPGSEHAARGSKRSMSVAPVALGRVGGGLMFEGRY